MSNSRSSKPAARARDWFQTSPHGTARERFERIAPLLTGRRANAATPAAGADGHAAAAGEPENSPDGEHAHLAAFFRNLVGAARAHDLGDESLYLAEELAEMQWSLGSRQKRALALLALATMVGVRQGSSCVPLEPTLDSHLGRLITSLLEVGRLGLDPGTVLHDIHELTRANTLDQVIGRADEYRPMIVADGRIYQHRMLWCEDRLARRLRELLAMDTRVAFLGSHESRIDAALADVLERAPVYQGRRVVLSDEQRAVVRRALSSRFTVISGGPGTGKTSMVVTMLRVLCRLGEPVDRIAMAAPTGKAANRMWSSIRSGLAAIEAPARDDRTLMEHGVEPRTVHRLLGYLPGSDRFRHHENHPLMASTVIVDEASMIDLWLMERLVRAIPLGARVIVLGDADQLPSVDAGAVLRDLVAAGQRAETPFAVRLTHSYRMDEGDPAGRAILMAARAVNAGRADDVLVRDERSPEAHAPRRSAAKELAYHGIEHLDSCRDISDVHQFVDHWYKARITTQSGFALRDKVYHYRGDAWVDEDRADLDALFKVYETSRILTVTRRQNTGSEALNRRLHQKILREASVDKNPSFYPGEPVIMQRNDYQRGLFNGDQGMIVRVSEDYGAQQFRVVFPRGESYALFRLDSLRAHIELAFAMTVHKSQGSEFDEVALILPTEDLPLLSREMLYTGITRARRSVVLVAGEELLRVAIERQSVRFSGLGDKLAHGTRAGVSTG